MQMQLYKAEEMELMVLEGISPLAITSQDQVEAYNKNKKDLDENVLDDNIDQIAKEADLSPKQVIALKANQKKKTKKRNNITSSAAMNTRSQSTKSKSL